MNPQTIQLKFNDTYIPQILNGTKTRTTRIRPHGKPGDIFFCRGVAFVITSIQPERIYQTAHAYAAEGYTTQRKFLKDLCRIYPDPRICSESFHLMLYEGESPKKFRSKFLTEQQREESEKRFYKLFRANLYAHHFQKYGHVDITAMGGIL